MGYIVLCLLIMTVGAALIYFPLTCKFVDGSKLSERAKAIVKIPIVLIVAFGVAFGGTYLAAHHFASQYAEENPTYKTVTRTKYELNTVYVTSTGECYHARDCGYLWNSSRAITKQAAYSRGLRACSVCGGVTYSSTRTSGMDKAITYKENVIVDPAPGIQTTALVWSICVGVAWAGVLEYFYIKEHIYDLKKREDPPPQLQK